MSLGLQISQLRKVKKWTQAQLAQAAELSASTIAMYETNRRAPDGVSLSKLATALGVSPDALEIAVSASVRSITDKSAARIKGRSPGQGQVRRQVQDQVSQKNGSQPSVNASIRLTPVQQDVRVVESPPAAKTTTLALSREEARIILFLRMNPATFPFIESYMASPQVRRNQLEKTWKVIESFQPRPEA